MNGDELREWMQGSRYSVRSLAGALGVSPATVQDWRSGKYAIPPYLHLALRSLAPRP